MSREKLKNSIDMLKSKLSIYREDIMRNQEVMAETGDDEHIRGTIKRLEDVIERTVKSLVDKQKQYEEMIQDDELKVKEMKELKLKMKETLEKDDFDIYGLVTLCGLYLDI